MLAKRYITLNAGLGEETEWMGNLVRPILVEKVEQDWLNGKISNESRNIVESGRMALVVPPGGFS